MRERLATAAIVVFVLVDIVLVTLAFRHVRPADPPTDTAPPAASPSPSMSSPPPDAAAPGPTYLSLASDGTLLRATRGSCDGDAAPVVQVSTDGQGFEDVTVDEGLREVLRVQADASDNVWLVGAGSNCRFGVYRGAADTSGWSFSRGTGGAWHLLPAADAQGVHSPTGRVDTPCRPINVSTAGGSVPRVLCADGSILGTSDNGSTWIVLGELPDAVAVGYTSPSTGFALAGQDNCSAAVLRTDDGGSSWARLECLGEGRPLAMAVNGSAIAALVGDTLQVSDDSGESWVSRSSAGG
jgi:hypothetical protein